MRGSFADKRPKIRFLSLCLINEGRGKSPPPSSSFHHHLFPSPSPCTVSPLILLLSLSYHPPPHHPPLSLGTCSLLLTLLLSADVIHLLLLSYCGQHCVLSSPDCPLLTVLSCRLVFLTKCPNSSHWNQISCSCLSAYSAHVVVAAAAAPPPGSSGALVPLRWLRDAVCPRIYE